MNPTKKVSLKKAFSHSQSARKKFLGAKTLGLEMWHAVESVWVSRVGNSPKVVCYFNSVKIQVYQIILSTWLS